MIQIYLVQHGMALSDQEDTQRPLSDEGRVQLQRVAEHLQAHDVVVGKIVHSGKLRALQSADIFADALNVKQVIASQGMNPNDDVKAFIENLDEDEVMYVGHLPQLERVVSQLLCDQVSQPVIKFQNAAVVCLQIKDDHGALVWYLPPVLC